MCWGNCPAGTIEECGALCLTMGSCSGYVLDTVTEVGELAGSIAATANGDVDIEGIISGSADIAGNFILPICNA